MIARVAPEDKVRLVSSLKRKGQIVAMTGDGVNDAPALKSADIGIAMGITGTEVSKEAATMILTDDNFATIVKAVELGRGLYDNLTKYIRFQMGVLVGFIVTFLGASIFNIVGGVPFVPLQTLYINFTTQVLQAIGLGYGRPAEGLMKRKPRPSDEQILPRPLLIWVCIAGLVLGGATLGVIGWADDHYGSSAIARTMGMTTFAISNVVFSLATRDERRSIFSLDVLEDRMFVICSAGSVAAILFGTELGVFQRILGTVHLDLHQWLVCIVVGLAIVPVSEARRLCSSGAARRRARQRSRRGRAGGEPPRDDDGGAVTGAPPGTKPTTADPARRDPPRGRAVCRYGLRSMLRFHASQGTEPTTVCHAEGSGFESHHPLLTKENERPGDLAVLGLLRLFAALDDVTVREEDRLEGDAPLRRAPQQELEVHPEVLELLALRVLHDRPRLRVWFERYPLLIPADRLRLFGHRRDHAGECPRPRREFARPARGTARNPFRLLFDCPEIEWFGCLDSGATQVL